MAKQDGKKGNSPKTGKRTNLSEHKRTDSSQKGTTSRTRPKTKGNN